MDLTTFDGRKTELRDLGFLQDVFDGISLLFVEPFFLIPSTKHTLTHPIPPPLPHMVGTYLHLLNLEPPPTTNCINNFVIPYIYMGLQSY